MLNNLPQLTLDRLKKNVEKVMRSPSNKAGDTVFEFGLKAISQLYGGAAFLRRRLYQKKVLEVKKLPAFVVSVGNIAVGGTGKTPMVIYLAKLFKKGNCRPAIISRGYGGTAVKTGCIVSNGSKIIANSLKAGDEPIMMARQLTDIPVIIGRNRFESGMIAIKEYGCDVIILDDGYQHMNLARDLNIALLDAKEPLGNGHIVPRGILREPCSAILDADAIVLTRSLAKEPKIPGNIARLVGEIPCFSAGQTAYLHEVYASFPSNSSLTLKSLEEKKVYLFSGIARNNDFSQTIESFGAIINGHDVFDDHHRYTSGELDQIIQNAVQSDSQIILTTEKDLARMDEPPQWSLPFAIIGVRITFFDHAFDSFVMDSSKV